jgi:hypothetical protein
MTITRLSPIAAALVALAFCATPVSAQDGLRPPAELPPAGFSGAQFVDSSGCVYIRAGVAGAVTWVPRVTRDRKPVCGYTPSFPPDVDEAAAPVVVPAATAAPVRNRTAAARPAAPSKTVPLHRSPGAPVIVTPAEAAQLPPGTRFLPRHLYDQRKAQPPVRTPKGYRSAWQDDRLNTRRAEQTFAGQSQMRAIWTDTVPRRLIQR